MTHALPLESEGSHALREEATVICGGEHWDEKRYITSTAELRTPARLRSGDHQVMRREARMIETQKKVITLGSCLTELMLTVHPNELCGQFLSRHIKPHNAHKSCRGALGGKLWMCVGVAGAAELSHLVAAGPRASLLLTFQLCSSQSHTLQSHSPAYW